MAASSTCWETDKRRAGLGSGTENRGTWTVPDGTFTLGTVPLGIFTVPVFGTRFTAPTPFLMFFKGFPAQALAQTTKLIKIVKNAFIYYPFRQKYFNYIIQYIRP